ncbi:hypothetical protein DFQ26_007218 [Actinomortierella ambigua]|nr:hypothetical protein DFQ26_007218 [Actinomortierella ambigua]
MSYEEEQHYFINRPVRLIPQLFTYPFPLDGSGNSNDSDDIPAVVVVTGNFDQWQRTVRLSQNKSMQRWEGRVDVNIDQLVPLGDQHRKLLYKFVLDGHRWVTDPNQPLERDSEGNLNNVRLLDIEERFGTQHSEDEAQQQQQQQDSSAPPLSPLQLQQNEEDKEDVKELIIDEQFATISAPVAESALISEEKEDEDVRGTPHFAVPDQAQMPNPSPQSQGEGNSQEIGSDSPTASSSDHDLASHQILAEHKDVHMPMQEEESRPEAMVEATHGAPVEGEPAQPHRTEKADVSNAVDEEEQNQQDALPGAVQQSDDYLDVVPSETTVAPATIESSMTTSHTTGTLVAHEAMVILEHSVPTLEPLAPLMDMPKEATAVLPPTSATANTTGNAATHKRNSSSVLVFNPNAHPDEHDGDGDYGVVVLQGELITANTTNLLTSGATTTNTMATIRSHSDAVQQQIPPSPAASASTTTTAKTVTTIPPGTATTTLCGRHDTIEAAEDSVSVHHDNDIKIEHRMVSTPISIVPEKGNNMVVEVSQPRIGSQDKTLKPKKKRTAFWKKIKKVLS